MSWMRNASGSPFRRLIRALSSTATIERLHPFSYTAHKPPRVLPATYGIITRKRVVPVRHRHLQQTFAIALRHSHVGVGIAAAVLLKLRGLSGSGGTVVRLTRAAFTRVLLAVALATATAVHEGQAQCVTNFCPP